MNNFRILLAAILFIINLTLLSCAVEMRPDANTNASDQAVTSEFEDMDKANEKVMIKLSFPLFSDLFLSTPVALVNEEPVRLGELIKEITSHHGELMTGDQEGEKASASVEENYRDLLNRVINARLIVEEARNIGLDELPVIQAQIKDKREKVLRKILFKNHLDNFEAEAPEEEVMEVFRDKVKEYKLNSLSFKDRDDAERALEEIRSGKDFDSVGNYYIEKGKAEGSENGGSYVEAKELLPHVADIIRAMEPGEISPVVNVPGGKLVIFRFEDIRYPDNPGELESARQVILTLSRNSEIASFMDALVEKYATIDKKLIKKLDFEEKNSFTEFLEDDRVIATIKGEDPVAVKDVATKINETLFHGVEQAINLNDKKNDVLDGMIKKIVLNKEALSLGLDKTEEYKDIMVTFERGLLFGAFVEKAVVPDAKLTHAEVKGYYEEHKNEFMTPEMMRIDGQLVFESRRHAEDAAVKLREGTDMKWLLEHAEGLVNKKPEDLMDFGGRLWSVKGLPADVQKIVKNSREGDIRVYESPKGDYYVLIVTDVIQPRPRPFNDVKLEIAKDLHGKKIAKLVEEWAEKLREEYTVEIFIDQIK